MDDMQTKVAETEQEHLRGGQESPDMEVFREQWRENVAMNDLINAVGALCTQLFFLIGELTTRNELAEQANRHLEDIRNNVRGIADCIHGTVYDDASVKINTGLDDLVSDMADALHAGNGDGIGDSLGQISTDIGCACDPQTDHRMKVHVSGELANYPQPY